MLSLLVRSAIVALFLCVSGPLSLAADKTFRRDELTDSAIKLEAEIKKEAGAVGKSAATLRTEIDAAVARKDVRGALQLSGRLVSVQPNQSANWLRLARLIFDSQTADRNERTSLIERASTAAYIAYQRATRGSEEADALALLSRTFSERKLWRPALDSLRLSLELKEVPELRAQYEQARLEHGFRLLDYSVDSDAVSPRICFQFSEDLPGKRTDFSPFIVVAGIDRPALTVDERQLCVEGLRHGERYGVTLRPGLPSTVKETLPRSAQFNIYVRDRKPFVRFTNKAYVLPKMGQQGIPLISVNTDTVNLELFRIGDRNLLNTVLGDEFQRNLDRYDAEQLATERGMQVWKGQLKVEQTLNTDVTTAFPVEQALGTLSPGVYVMLAEAAGPKSDSYEAVATQWFIVSDLGLAAYSASDGITAFVQSLASAEAKSGIEVRLLARNNEELAVRTSDAAGMVRFEAGLGRGQGGLSPAMIVASEGKTDYAFLSLKSPAFDLSDRGVAGRNPTPGLDAFVYAERGVYRPGETVHLTALLRDAQGSAAAEVPLTLVIERPDGVEYRRLLLGDAGLGGRSWSLPLVSTSSPGTYRVRAFVDPKGEAVGRTSFMVEDYVPDRLEFELSASAASISKAAPASVSVEGRFLYGAPASGMELEGEVAIRVAKERGGWSGYHFGLSDEEIPAENQPLEDLPTTDSGGRAKFNIVLGKVPAATRPLEAQITLRMAEAGGRAVERSLTLPVAATTTMIGVKPLFSGKALGEGDSAAFDLVVVGPDNQARAARELRYELLQVETRYQWYRRDGSWEYEPIKKTQRVANGSIQVGAGHPARISVPTRLGRYRLEVSGEGVDNAVTSFAFDAGYYAEATADTPDLLEIALDKAEYQAGDTLNIAVAARTAGKITIAVIGDRLITTTTVDAHVGTATIPIRVGADWGTGAYVLATLRRPLDAQAQRMPGRAIGVQWFSIGRQARILPMSMPAPDLVRPNTTLRVPVNVPGLPAGEEARITVAAVDVGILNLTSYKSPAPDEHYLGQRKLAAEIRDLYGQLIDGMQGARGQIRTGGDSSEGALTGSPPTGPPLALYSGLVNVGPNGSAEVLFDLPAFAGTVRVMAVGWARDKVGHAVKDVIVRDPVVLTATLPRFLLMGDRSNIQLEIDNVEGDAGEYRVVVKTSANLRTTGETSQTVQLAAKQRRGVSLPLVAAGVGAGNVTVSVSGPRAFSMERSYALALKPATQVLTRRTVTPLAKGQSLTVSPDLFADLVPGTASAAISIGPSTAIDVPALLQALDRYPFGCTEQIASRALPLLYVNELAKQSHLAQDASVDERVRGAIDHLLARQGSDGSFGLWSTGGEDTWLDAYVTDFLTRAREKGFTVPDVAFKLAIDHLRNFVNNAQEPSKDGGREVAYALYVLARNGAAPMGDLRYLAETRLAEIATPIAKAQLAAALAMLGDKGRADRVYSAALAAIEPKPKIQVGREDYGSALRDAAALVTLASEGGAPQPTLTGALARVEAARGLSNYTSTQEQAWLVLAARALGKEMAATLDVNGEVSQGPLYRRVRGDDLAARPLRVVNVGEQPLQAVVSVTGAPTTPEPATERGFKIERQYYTLTGERVDASKAKQNQRFAVVLKITEPQPQFGRIIVADYLPSGFEIDNPRLVSSGDTGTLDWIEDAAEPVHSEFRDDRFAAAFQRSKDDKAVFTVAYVVRAVTPGRFMHPQAIVEDMYRPDRFGRTGTGSLHIDPAR